MPFLEHAERLHKVAIHGPFNFSWRHNILSKNLTHLSLFHVAQDARPSTVDLQELLDRCSLQSLSLTASLPLAEEFLGFLPLDPLPDGFQKLQWPTLSRCHIDDLALAIVDFMRRVEVPLACHISLGVGCEEDAIDDLMMDATPLQSFCYTVKDICDSRGGPEGCSLRCVQMPDPQSIWTFEVQLPDGRSSILDVYLNEFTDPDDDNPSIPNYPLNESFSAYTS